MNKKDFKYIIKRIIIGVGIVFCVGFLNKCSVRADSFSFCLDDSSLDCPLNYDDISFSFDSPYSNNVYHFMSDSDNSTSFIIMYNNLTDSYYALYTDDSSSLYNIDIYDMKVSFSNDNNNSVYSLGFKCLDSSDSSCLNGYKYINNITSSFVLTNDADFNVSPLGGSQYYYVLSSDFTGEYIINGDNNITLSNEFIYNNFGNFTIYSTNLNSFYIDNTEIEINPIPSYFTQLDMQQHAGVYFVPKDYSTLQTVLNSQGQRVYVFNYYYEGKFSEGYFPLSDYGKIVFFYYDYTSRDNKSYNSSWFPFSVTEDSTTYDYFAFIIENDDYGSLNQHLPSYIYYDSRYFDYYFIDDFFDYNENISYIDKSGNTVSSDVSITDSLRSLYKQGFQNRQSAESIAESMIHSLDNNVLGQYLDFITIPFNFLWSFTNSTCEPIVLPVPFVNSEITLPCLSSVFEEHVPALKNIIFIVVNGFLVFRITMRNIDTVTDVLKADDDKIEVVDL